MWKNEECLIAAFLQNIAQDRPLTEDITPSMEDSIIERMPFHREVVEIPEWLQTSTPEEIAVEIMDFKKKEFPEEGYFGFHRITRHYWSNKGFSKFLMPPEIQVKIEKAELLAEKAIRKEEETIMKERFVKEKEELPSLVSQCVDWARINGLKRLTHADVDTYILEKELDILQETKRAIYSMSNLKLKTGK
jgi:hypothetical protein